MSLRSASKRWTDGDFPITRVYKNMAVTSPSESRKKLKWSDDPRNTKWSRDRSRFGYRMLERMGWTEGRGLGSKEDGQSEHVQVAKKSDTLGVGARGGRDEDWVEQQAAFEEILSQLHRQHPQDSRRKVPSEGHPNSGRGGEGGANCLTTLAAATRHLTYSKFIRGKDLSSKSAQDLSCVLGKRRRRRKGGSSNKEGEEGQGEDKSTPTSPSQATAHGVTTITRTVSVDDYFKQKIATMRKTRCAANETTPNHKRTKHL